MPKKPEAAKSPLRRHGSSGRRRYCEPLPARYRNRPQSIRAAIARCKEIASAIGITTSETRALQSIIANCASRDNGLLPMFARKKTISTDASVSEATVYRLLRKLERCNFLLRVDQARFEDGVLGIAEIRLTEEGSRLLGLPILTEGCQTAPARSEEASQTGQQLTDGLTDGSYIKKEQVVDRKASEVHQSAGEFVKRDGRSIPAELDWLISEKLLSYPQLFALMAHAGRHGKRFSDIVLSRSRRIRALQSAGARVRYLLSLVRQDIDFSAVLKHQLQAIAAEGRRSEDVARRRELERWARWHDGQTFVAPNGRFFTVSGASCSLLVRQAMGGADSARNTRLTEEAVRHVREGIWKPYREPEISWEDRRAAMLRHLGSRRPAGGSGCLAT